MDIQKVDTWLPCFSGFYGTIWETDNDEEMEIENINDERKNKGLDPITWDDVEWDYKGYQNSVVSGLTKFVGGELKRLGIIDGYKLQKLVSPREYNFANDSINVEFSISKKNVINVADYLAKHTDAFAEYIAERYTSRSGFISFHSNDATAWMGDNLGPALGDGHKLASILQFILLNENDSLESDAYEDLHGNGCFVQASNYSKLLNTEEVPS